MRRSVPVSEANDLNKLLGFSGTNVSLKFFNKMLVICTRMKPSYRFLCSRRFTELLAIHTKRCVCLPLLKVTED